MNPSLGGVTLNDATGDLNGYAWSDNIGWVSFDATDGTHPSAIINNITTCGSACVVSGWAKAIVADGNGWDGWIKMRDAAAPAYSVNLDKTTGNFSGWAWGSDVVGWIDFNGVILGSVSVPTVDLKVNGSDNPPSVPAPADLTVSWTTTNTSQLSSCSGTGQGWTGPKSTLGGNDSGGNLDDIPAGTYTYSITCDKTTGGTISDSVTITVTALTYALTVSKPGIGSGTVTSAPAGINCGTDCTENYNSGTSVTLTASPAGGSTFAGWSGSGCSGTGSCTVSMTQDRNVTATFTLAAAADFSLTSDNAILATINAGQGSLAVSNTTLIKVVPVNGYNETVSLSSNISSVISGATDNFSKTTLNSSEYSAGSAFSVSIPPTTLAGLYVITVQGDGTTITGKTVNVNLNVEIYDINYCEPPWCPE